MVSEGILGKESHQLQTHQNQMLLKISVWLGVDMIMD